MAEELTIWEDALDRLDVAWCDGAGCTRGSRDQHLAGFRTADAVHLTFPPPEDAEGVEDRTRLHEALRLVGRVEADRTFPDLAGRVRARAAFDFATDSMRAGGSSVPKAVLDDRPNGPGEDVRLFVADEDADAEAPGMVVIGPEVAEAEDDG
jgi:hypothetical protein